MPLHKYQQHSNTIQISVYIQMSVYHTILDRSLTEFRYS